MPCRRGIVIDQVGQVGDTDIRVDGQISMHHPVSRGAIRGSPRLSVLRLFHITLQCSIEHH